jgi:hypothetical protein
MDKSRKSVILNVIHHGHNPSECKKKTGSLEMLELVVAIEQMAHEMLKPPHEYHIAQGKNNFKYSSNRNVLVV